MVVYSNTRPDSS